MYGMYKKKRTEHLTEPPNSLTSDENAIAITTQNHRERLSTMSTTAIRLSLRFEPLLMRGLIKKKQP